MNSKAIKILDCTLRDGGYYNDWDFDAEVVSKYLNAMSASSVDVVELGLRQVARNRYLGAHAYLPEFFLSSLDLPSNLRFAFMIDAKTILDEFESVAAAFDYLIMESDREHIEIVRLAANLHEVSGLKLFCQRLKNSGFSVIVNIMQASLSSECDLKAVVAEIDGWACVEVVYFADSLGSMVPKDVKRIYECFSTSFRGEIGFHAHNNMGLANANALCAAELGCTWIDVTVTGMGRGAGNAVTEQLIPLLTEQAIEGRAAVYELAEQFFEPLKKELGWGPSPTYAEAARMGMHPTYPQFLLADERVTSSDRFRILRAISNTNNPAKFSIDTLNSSVSQAELEGCAAEAPFPPIFESKEVVLVCQAGASNIDEAAIDSYAKSRGALTMSLNLPSLYRDVEYDFIVISHTEKLRQNNMRDFGKMESPSLIGPASLLGDSFGINLDYGVQISPGRLEAKGRYAVIPNGLTLGYALAICLEARASCVSLVGFKGYDLTPHRNKETQMVLELASKRGLLIKSLTPTNFVTEESSLYALS